MSAKLGIMPNHGMIRVGEATLIKGKPKWNPQSWTAYAVTHRRTLFYLNSIKVVTYGNSIIYKNGGTKKFE